jgi:hypothetical protein
MLKGPGGTRRDTRRQKFDNISRQVSPRFATRCLLQIEQRTQVDEPGMIITQIRSPIDQYGTLYTIPAVTATSNQEVLNLQHLT